MFTLLCLSLGALLTLGGLLLIAPQVRVHQIEAYSRGSWLFRAGMALSALGLLVLRLTSGSDDLRRVGLVIGVAGVMGGLITWGHEYHQAKEHGAERWDWPRSLTLQMIASGAIVLTLGWMAIGS